jgi:hypothetical protein
MSKVLTVVVFVIAIVVSIAVHLSCSNQGGTIEKRLIGGYECKR